MKLLHIGRGLDNEIVVNDTTVSRRHAQLLIDEQGVARLIDLNSSNGTFVNGHRIHGQVTLDSMDIVKVGDYLLPWRNHVAAHKSQPAPVPPTPQVAEPVALESPAPQEPVVHKPSEPTPEAKSGKFLMWVAGIVAFVGAGTAVVVLIFMLIVPRATSADITGRWHEIDDPRSWIEFKSDHTYAEGYGNTILFKDATWATSGGRTLMIKREGVTLVKDYTVEDGILTLRQGNFAVEFEQD